MKINSLLVHLCFAQLLFAQSNNNQQYVNPFIGTGGHGHTFPGATVPFSMVQLSPDTRTEGWDACGGYHYDDSTILGFSHTHLNGTGIADFCDVLITPQWGASLAFQHKNEIAKAGYYSVKFDKVPLKVELTASERVGFHRYTLPMGSKNARFTIRFNARNQILQGDMQKKDAKTISGTCTTTGWAKSRNLSFNLESNAKIKTFTKRIITHATWQENVVDVIFEVPKNEQLSLKVALSPVSEQNARENLAKEIPHWDFDKTRKEAEQKWAKYLNRIEITGDNEQKTIFYTALYHALIHPSVWQDVNGDYRGLDNKVHNTKGFAYHSIFSLWDTYRAAHPLYTIVCPEKVSDFVNSFIDDFEKTGHLPMWNFPGNETWCMIGNHAIPVIADAYLKNIKGFDAEKALKAMIATANRDSLGLKQYREQGYIPANTEGESVSKTLEYAYDDYCIAQMAKAMGHDDIYKTFIQRSQNWKNIFNPKSGFFQAKMNETFVEPFEPREVNFHFTEGNAWQYAFAVQHDIEGLIEILGGKAAFEAKLDAFFGDKSETTGRDQVDLTGLIGQYAHGNEPSHHIAYLYNYVGKPQKAQRLIRQILTEFYKNAPDGLIGNEDCGQMSAWYVLSSMGFYPVNPCGGNYQTGVQIFENPKISINGHSISFNLNNADGKLLKLISLPNNASVEILDSVKIQPFNPTIIPMPYIAKGNKLFKEKQTIVLACVDKNADIYYSTDGSIPSLKYTQPIDIQESITLRFFSKKENKQSNEAKAVFKESNYGFNVQLKNPPAPQYSSNSEHLLADGERGSEHWQLGGWQGFEGVDLEAVIDLKEIKSFKRLAISCVQDQNAWIFFPTDIQFWVSENGRDFTEMGRLAPEIGQNTEGVQMQEFDILSNGKARYVKIIAKPLVPIPAWHKGAGGKGWIFADEIIVE